VHVNTDKEKDDKLHSNRERDNRDNTDINSIANCSKKSSKESHKEVKEVKDENLNLKNQESTTSQN